MSPGQRNLPVRLAPSILVADLADLASVLQTCERGGADLVHVDVMDGRFVPVLTFGPPLVAALARHTKLPLDVHLMVAEPERFLEDFLAAGAAWISVHWEAAVHLDRLLARIRSGGARAGVALNPATPVEHLIEVLPQLDFVLLMAVNPGYAGQPFLPYVLAKAKRLRQLAEDRGIEVEIEMDGGIGSANIRQVVAAGTDTVVAGSAVFREADPMAALAELRRLARMEVGE